MSDDEKAAAIWQLYERGFTNLVEAMKRMAYEPTPEEGLERTADCAARYLEELIEREAFGLVRRVIRDAQELMSEAIDCLEEKREKELEFEREIENERRALRGLPHRHSA